MVSSFETYTRRRQNIGIGHFILRIPEILRLHMAFFNQRIEAIMN